MADVCGPLNGTGEGVRIPWATITMVREAEPVAPPAPGIAVRDDGRLVFASDTPEGAQRVAIG